MTDHEQSRLLSATHLRTYNRIPDCDYTTICDSVCNKCGHIHRKPITSPAPPAKPASDTPVLTGWREKCIVDCNLVMPEPWYVSWNMGYLYLRHNSTWRTTTGNLIGNGGRHDGYWPNPAAAISALLAADPPPLCTEPDAIAERHGVEYAKAGNDLPMPHLCGHPKEWNAYLRGYNRQAVLQRACERAYTALEACRVAGVMDVQPNGLKPRDATLADDRCKQCGKRCPNATCPACQEQNVREANP